MRLEVKMTRNFAGRTRTARVWSGNGTHLVICEAEGRTYETAEPATLEAALTAARKWVDR